MKNSTTRGKTTPSFQPSDNLLDPVSRLLMPSIKFDPQHRYQFLLFYLPPYLQFLFARTLREKINRGEKISERGILGKKLRYLFKSEKEVNQWAFALARKKSFSLFFKHTVFQLERETLDSYLRFLFKVPISEIWQNFLRKGALLNQNWMIPDQLEVEHYFQYLKIMRPPIVDSYVLAGLTYIHTQYRKQGGAVWRKRWRDTQRYLTLYCGHTGHRVGVQKQRDLLDTYTTYLAYVKKYPLQYALSYLSKDRRWKFRSTEQKEIFMLNAFFSAAEDHFINEGFKRQDYIAYVKRILKNIQSGKKPKPARLPKLMKLLQESQPRKKK
ncbi:MAG: hypothetical protein GXO90_00950 [FCB group bacterium]|nr:hypothetical protein [FCB group bacterium]